MMRIATANTFDRTVDNLMQRQTEMARQQERLSSGKRVLKASDDPVAATLAETAQNRLTRVQADQRALDASRTSLEQAESGLAESGELIMRVRELLVSAGNGTFTDAERADIAKQLEGLREQMIAVANRTDNAGRTLFGGLGGSPRPFVDLYTATGAGVRFDGQRGQVAPGDNALPAALDGDAIWMRVPQGNGAFAVSLGAGNTGGASANLGQVSDATALTGSNYRIEFTQTPGGMTYSVIDTTAVPAAPVAGHNGVAYTPEMTIEFEGIQLQLQGTPATGDTLEITANPPATDIFAVVQSAIEVLRSEGSNETAVRRHGLERAIAEIDAGHDRVLLARGRVGEWLNRADSLESLFTDRDLAFKKEKSSYEDLDMVEGISDFQKQQTAFEAAIKSYAQIQRLSLFSALG